MTLLFCHCISRAFSARIEAYSWVKPHRRAGQKSGRVAMMQQHEWDEAHQRPMKNIFHIIWSCQRYSFSKEQTLAWGIIAKFWTAGVYPCYTSKSTKRTSRNLKLAGWCYHIAHILIYKKKKRIIYDWGSAYISKWVYNMTANVTLEILSFI